MVNINDSRINLLISRRLIWFLLGLNQCILLCSVLIEMRVEGLPLPKVPTSLNMTMVTYSLYCSACFIILLKYEDYFRSLSSQLEHVWAKIELVIEPSIIEKMLKSNKINKTAAKVLAYWMPIYAIPLFARSFSESARVAAFYFSVLGILAVYATFVHLFFHTSLVICCQIIGYSFEFVSIRLENALNEPTMNYKRLSYYRWLHLNTVKLLQTTNHVWKNYLPVFIISFLSLNIFLSYYLMFHSTDLVDKIIYTSWVFENSLVIYLVLSKVMSVHTKAHEASDHVYRLTLFEQDERFILEAHLFLSRLRYKDVGFTFGDVFLLTSQTTITFFSLISPVVIAFPSFRNTAF